MTWIYRQNTGELTHTATADFRCVGYSGYGEGLNNPDLQHVRNVGPLPKGTYEIGAPYNSKRVGRFALPLTPIDADTFGRDYFRIHGDNKTPAPQDASHGCIIIPLVDRKAIAASGDNLLMVI